MKELLEIKKDAEKRMKEIVKLLDEIEKKRKLLSALKKLEANFTKQKFEC